MKRSIKLYISIFWALLLSCSTSVVEKNSTQQMIDSISDANVVKIKNIQQALHSYCDSSILAEAQHKADSIWKLQLNFR